MLIPTNTEFLFTRRLGSTTLLQPVFPREAPDCRSGTMTTETTMQGYRSFRNESGSMEVLDCRHYSVHLRSVQVNTTLFILQGLSYNEGFAFVYRMRAHARTHARTQACAHARTHERTHARTHARTHTHTLKCHLKCVLQLQI